MIEFALVLYIAFLGVAFGWRGWLQHRRTGDHGFRGFSGRTSRVEWLAGVCFTSALVAFFLAPVSTLLGLLDCVELPGWISGLGILVSIGGFALVVLAQLDMGSSWRVGVDPTERTRLVTTGLFAVVRNPIFSALGLFALGFAMMVPNLLAALGVAIGALGLQLQVRFVEEPFLLRAHGETYREYAARVGRFVPRPGLRHPREI